MNTTITKYHSVREPCGQSRVYRSRLAYPNGHPRLVSQEAISVFVDPSIANQIAAFLESKERSAITEEEA
jgi:hypothetical protein